MQKVYLDNAATTRVHPEVVQAMLPYFSEQYGNPSSPHSWGQEAEAALMHARAQVAAALNAAKPEEIIFTGGGSESDNMVLRGVAHAYARKGRHIITSAVEHHAVLHTLEAMEREGLAEVTYLPVDADGLVSVQDVADAIRPDTILVSIMFANNEVGTIMPVAEIGALCRERGVLFHTDAVQAVGHVPVDVQAQNIDLLSLSAHKFHGPKGIGALYVKKGVRVPALILGGAQERGKRAGTENVPGIVGLGVAIERASAHLEEHAAHMRGLRDRLIAIGQSACPGTLISASAISRASPSCSCSTSTASPPRAAPPARPARSTRRTCSLRWGSRTRWRTARCA